MEFPTFKYHPDPIATGSVEPSENECRCCGQRRGFIYTASVFAEDDLEDAICPWCIADGSAARKLDAMFLPDFSLREAGIEEDIINEVVFRTPGFVSWQEEEWLCHCNDACTFHGDAPKEEIEALGDEELARLGSYFGTNDAKQVREFLEGYEPGGEPAVYKFKCRHCGKVLYNADFG